MTIRSERHDSAVVVTIDDPGTRNSLDLAAVDDLTSALTEAGRLTDISGIILTGNGAFCSGANLRSVAARAAGSTKSERRNSVEAHAQGLVRTIVGLPVPTIAAIDGAAVGMGFDLALACDCRLVGPDGWCMQGWGRVGLIGGTGGDLFLRKLNPSLIWKLLEEQPRINGVMAELWGIGENVERLTAVEAAVRRVESYSILSRAALTSYVDLHRTDVRRALDAHLATCGEMQVELLADPLFSERVARLIGSRPSRGVP